MNPNLYKISHIARSIGALALLLVPAAHAATVNLDPTADAFVTPGRNGSLSISNYGGAGALSVAAAGLAKGEFQSVLQFNLSSAQAAFDAQYGPGQWTLQSISLALAATAPNNAIFNPSSAGQFGISWMQNDSWVEGTGTPASPGSTGITYASLPSFTSAADESLGAFSFDGSTTGSATYTLALTPGFYADAAGGNLVSLRLFAADSGVSYLFDSRNFGTASLRPVLSVVAVPEPGALALLGMGCGCVLWGYRSRRRLGTL
ncbi:MAG TPA: PEP-CTERM sorting domain-containing protein [Candidatus Acidoferrum sp.]|nr:PEP-CTERM sorting domain-containing protein [Candidatus Acidoferrum sp.]